MLSWIECHPGLASWLQAFGSIVAIIIAIWVPYWQKKQAQAQSKLAEREQVRHLLRNLRDEMIVVEENFDKGNGKALMEVPAGQPFNYIIPIVERPFPIYDGSTAKLGQIPNDNLRRTIITGYGHANGFVGSIRMNNVLVERFEQAHYLFAIHNDEIHRELREVNFNRLATYSDSLKSSYAAAKEKIQQMRLAIEAELGVS